MKGLLLVDLVEFMMTPLIEFTEGYKNEGLKLETKYTTIRKAFKGITGYPFDNGILVTMDSYGNPFKMSVHLQEVLFPKKEQREESWVIHTWDATGSTQVIRVEFPVVDMLNDKMPSDTKNTLLEALNGYTHGKRTCSGCQKTMDVTEVAGQYFAGLYCKTCWETKYRAIEAKETYD